MSEQSRRDVERLFYTYSVDTGSVAAGATASGSISIEADADFVVAKSAYFATDGAGAAQTKSSQIVPNVAVQITDTGSGRNLLDAAQPIPSIFGTGAEPFIWPVAQVLRANSVIRFSFTSVEATATRRVWLSLIGFKLYRY